MKKLIVLGALFLTAIPVHAQDPQRALRPETAALIGVGRVQADFGVEFDQRARYSLSGLEGDLLRFGILNFRVGVGDYAEFQISGVGRDFFSVTKRSKAVIATTFSGDNTSDFGDLILGAKLKLLPEKGHRPALSFKFAVQLPNASNERGLGADQTEFYSSLLFTKHLGRAEFAGNLGLAILGSAVQSNSQADMLTYGLGMVVPLHPRFELVAEVSGRQGPLRIGNENLAQARAGARIHAAGLLWDLMGIAGLKHFDPRSGLALGVSYEFQAFNKKRGPVTVKPEKSGK